MRVSEATMETVGLGPLTVSRVVFGCVLLGDRTPAEQAPQLLDRFLDAGGTLLDTADVYGDGMSERVLAPWLAQHREDVAAGLGGRGAVAPRVGGRSSRCNRNTRFWSARSSSTRCSSAAPPASACCRGDRSARGSSPAATAPRMHPSRAPGSPTRSAATSRSKGATRDRRHLSRRRRVPGSRRRARRHDPPSGDRLAAAPTRHHRPDPRATHHRAPRRAPSRHQPAPRREPAGAPVRRRRRTYPQRTLIEQLDLDLATMRLTTG